MSPLARIMTLGAVVALFVAGAAFPASAHAEPSVARYKAGSTGTVTLVVGHGCNGSPTVKVDVRLPAGVSKPVPAPLKGWTTAVSTDQRQITWTGGSLPATQKGKFAFDVTFPNTSGATLALPMVQTCKVGVHRWVDMKRGSNYPVPTVKLT